MFDTLLPYLLAGVSVGGQYALIAVGYTLVYGILRLINFAHGDIFFRAPSPGYSAGDYPDGCAGLCGGARGV